MLKFPGNLGAEKFLAYHWQKKPLFMPRALSAVQPAVTRNELAWLATLEDVESRIVFTERQANRKRYRVENGPFDTRFLQNLPLRDWTLLVHDVEKHLPPMRSLFDAVPFVPDWRIDDLMISFAAPGGGVGPHRDNYDVFLCQGIGVREWQYSSANINDDAGSSDDLLLVEEFSGESHVCVQGDVLYLPPGVAHWGTSRKACITYSIGMRAPPYYGDPDLQLAEIRPGYISPAALARAGDQATSLGRTATELKEWLRPEAPDKQERETLLNSPAMWPRLRVHGMARLAYDENNVYVNGESRELEAQDRSVVASICDTRRLHSATAVACSHELVGWLLAQGAFELPDIP